MKAGTDPVSFQLNVRVKGNLEQTACKKSITGRIKGEMEDRLEAEIKTNIENVMEKAQEDKTDILGLKDALYRQHPDLWKKKQHEKNFPYSEKIDTHVDVQFIRFGHIKQ